MHTHWFFRELIVKLLPEHQSLETITGWKDFSLIQKGFPGDASGKEPACLCRRPKRHGFNPWVRKISQALGPPWRKAWQPTPAFLPGESHGQGSLAGYSPWDHRVGHNYSDLADRKSTRLNSSHRHTSRMPSSA